MTTEELVATGLPAEPVVQNPEVAQPPKEERDLLLPADPEVMRMVKSGQTMKMSGMWMLMLEIWSDQGRLDLFLHLLFSGNPKLLQT
jgi:hypothetical protein